MYFMCEFYIRIKVIEVSDEGVKSVLLNCSCCLECCHALAQGDFTLSKLFIVVPY